MFLQTSFKVAQRSIKSAGSPFNPTFWRSSSRRFLSTSQLSRSTSSRATTLGLLIGASSAVLLHTHSKILNEVANLGTINVNTNPQDYVKLVDTEKLRNPTRSRFGGKLHYKQLSYGSLSGVFFGVVIGKLSTVLGFIALSAFLLIQFLQTRGIVNVPWTTVLKVGSDRIDVRHLVLEDPSFKISFFLTFIIAAVSI